MGILTIFVLLSAAIGFGLSPVLSLPFVVALITVLTIILMGFINSSYQSLTIRVSDGKDTSISAVLRDGVNFMVSSGVVALLTALATLIGFLFFIIPGIIFWVWFQFVYIEIVKNKRSPIEAIKLSVANARKAPWYVAQLLILCTAVISAVSQGFIGAILAFLILYPILWLSIYYLYQRVSKLTKPVGTPRIVIWSTVLFFILAISFNSVMYGSDFSNQSKFNKDINNRVEKFLDAKIKQN